MKGLTIVSLCLAALLAASAAHAYAVYSHVDHKICVYNKASAFFGICDFYIDARGRHNGAHGSGLKDHGMIWLTNDGCRCVYYFDIPDGGYARVYDNAVKVYKHDGKQVASHDVYYCRCWGADKGKKKP